MKRAFASVAVSVAGFLLLFGSAAGKDRKRTAVDPAGAVVKVLGDDGHVEAKRPPRVERDPAGAPTAGPPVDCAPAPGTPGIQRRESRTAAGTIDACGRLRLDPGRKPRPAPALPSVRVTIDRMTTRGWYTSTYTPGGTILLLMSADTYHLSNGGSWESGAGTAYQYSARLDRVELSGSTIRYILLPPPEGFLYQQTDYDFGDHSAQGTLGVAGPLVIEATAGSSTAVMRGLTRIVANDATWYGEPRFNFYSSIVGSVVPFQQTYTLAGQTWAPDTFTRSFTYSNTGEVDFAHPVSVPRAVELTIGGPSRVPDESQVQFAATVRYDNGVRRSVTEAAGWEVAPAALATIQAGLLTTARLATPQETLTLRATYSEGNVSLSDEKAVLCVANDDVERPDAWPMYQANARHTGYLPISLDHESFALRWQRDVGGAFALNPVAAVDGKVFVTLRTYFDDVTSLFALDAVDGQTLWSKGFGSIFSVNPPSYAYGSVYVQTGNHGDDSWLRAYDAQTGEAVFQVAQSAQWERYFAPTIHEGKVYVNGGYYGGMYGFDAFAGNPSWFLDLPQYDEWTPAVAGGLAYAYLGEYEPGLYAADRLTGQLVFVIPDPAFDWDGWSMNLAPVAGTHDDVIAIHDGRLISFDTAQRSIRWQLPRGFQGQPSLAANRIFAVAAGRLLVLDEVTGNELWSWQPPEGALSGAMIVTDTHLLACTAGNVYAVDLAARQSVWSYPAAGHLALGNGTLYVASGDGSLTAIAMQEVVPVPIVSLEVTGPAEVVESSMAPYVARAHYQDGRIRDRTLSSSWSVAPDTYASVAPNGTMTTTELLQPTQDVVVRARYTERGQTVEGTLPVRLRIGVSLSEFIQRNLARSIGTKKRLLLDLEEALARERAALSVLRGLPPTPRNQLRVQLVNLAITREENAKALLRDSIDKLKEAQNLGTTPE